MSLLLLQRIGRITGRLPKQLADEVVGALMELFSPTENENAWHGGKLVTTAISIKYYWYFILFENNVCVVNALIALFADELFLFVILFSMI